MTPTKGKAQHTKGPWQLTGYIIHQDKGPELDAIAEVCVHHGRDANALLISSAPSLLEAAQLAYLALLRSGAYRLRVQPELIALRDSIAAALGLSEQEVQDNAESMVAYE